MESYAVQPHYNMWWWDIPELCSSQLPVISLTVLKIFSFSGSSGGTFLYLSLLREDELKLVLDLDNSLYRNRRKCAYPLIPVTRKCKLPWILVQLMKLSMLRASTVSLVPLPVPWQAEETDKMGTKKKPQTINFHGINQQRWRARLTHWLNNWLGRRGTLPIDHLFGHFIVAKM